MPEAFKIGVYSISYAIYTSSKASREQRPHTSVYSKHVTQLLAVNKCSGMSRLIWWARGWILYLSPTEKSHIQGPTFNVSGLWTLFGDRVFKEVCSFFVMCLFLCHVNPGTVAIRKTMKSALYKVTNCSLKNHKCHKIWAWVRCHQPLPIQWKWCCFKRRD